MGEPSFYANRRFEITRDGEVVNIVAGDRIYPAEFGNSFRRGIEDGRIIQIGADGTATGISLRMAQRLGLPVKAASPRTRKPPTVRKRFVLERNSDGLPTKVEYRVVSGPGAVAVPDSGAHGGREDNEGDRPPAPTEPAPRRRNILDRVLGRDTDEEDSGGAAAESVER